MDKIEELKKLKGLLDNGLVSQEEFNVLKSEILNDANTKPIEDDESNIKALQDNKDEILKANTMAEKAKLREIKTEKIEKSPELEKAIVKEVSEEKVEITDKRFQIPKWAYLFLLLLIPLGWWLFNGNSNELQQESKNVISSTENKKFKILNNTSVFNLTNLDYTGEVVSKKMWQDLNGNNIVLFTKSKDELYVFHYAVDNDKVKLLRKVKDFEYNCEYDLYLDFITNSIVVSNLDGDDYGEITFAYKKTCASDVSPKVLKLIIIENGDKYIIRGTTLLNINGYKRGGEKNIDESFNNAPKVFLTNSNKIWSEVVEEKIGQNSVNKSTSNEFGYIKGTDIIIRQSPNSSSKILGSFKTSGEKVSILEQSIDESESQVLLNRDMSIQIDGENVLIKKGKALEVITKNSDDIYTVQYEDANSGNYRRLNVPINHLDFSENKWYKVKRTTGVIGWVFGRFLDLSINKTILTKERNNTEEIKLSNTNKISSKSEEYSGFTTRAKFKNPKVGDFHEGGIVFWINPEDTTHGLVCAIFDQTEKFYVPWALNNKSNRTGTKERAIGTGFNNTNIIIAINGSGTGHAAGLARVYKGGGYTDWFLPSYEELNLMWENIEVINTASIANGGSVINTTRGGIYWSSTEGYKKSYAWCQYFSDGSHGQQSWSNKSLWRLVRAVRAF